MAKGKLTDAMRLFITTRLACYDRPTEVVEAVKEQYGIDISRQLAQSYDPTSVQGRKCGKKWKAIFEATRTEFLASMDAMPIAHRAYRLAQLQRLLDRAMNSKNAPLAAQLLEQAAKEKGEVFTNRQKLEHSGEVIGGVLVVPAPLTTTDWAQAAATQQAELARHRA